MAILDTYIPTNMLTGFDFSVLLAGAVTSSSSGDFRVDADGTFYDWLFGSDMYVGSDQYGRPVVTGTVTDYFLGEIVDGGYLLGISGVSVSFKDVMAAALTPTLLDDALLVYSAFAGNDEILGSDYNDVLSGFVGNDVVTAYAGNDYAYGDAGNDDVHGGDGADVVKGDAGNDIVNGGNGNDQVFGGIGLDTLTGGANYDRFVFDTAPSAANYDRITDFYVPQDTVALENGIMKALGAAVGTLNAALFWKSATGLAHDANDRIIYETDTGWLNYDSNGSAAGGAVHLALMGKNLALTNTDFVVI
jgi:serralysin